MGHHTGALRTGVVWGIVALVLAACGGTSPSASSTSMGPSPSAATPQPTPELVYVLPDGALPATAWVTVSRGPLELYGWPWRESGSAGYIDETAELLVGQTVTVDGEAWTEISGGGGEGWAPLATLAPRVDLKEVTCPPGSDLWTLAAMSPWERLTCFGGRALTLEGNEIVGSAEAMTSGDPAWLNGNGELAMTADGGMHSLDMHVAPGSVALDRPAFQTDVAPYRLQLTGHFNDPASVGCRVAPIPLGDETEQRRVNLDPAAAELACREQFVLTSLEVAGATPVPSTSPVEDTALLRVDRSTDVMGPWTGLSFVVFSDGRLVTASPNGWGWTERHLGDAALDELMTAARGETLLQKSASYGPPPGYAAGFTTWSIRIQRDSGMVTVSAVNASEADAARDVIALGDALIARVAALPDSAFTDELHAWMPPAYNLEINLSPGVLATYPSPPTFVLWADDAVLPLSTPLIETGPVVRAEPDGATIRCAVIDAATASSLRAAFYAAGYPRYDGSLVNAEFELGWRATNGLVEVRIQAVPPDEAADFHCALTRG